MLSPEALTARDHETIRQKYVTLAWDLWREQSEAGFFVWHPLPEEHLRIEVVMFWSGQISRIHGWNTIIKQMTDAILTPMKNFMMWIWDNVFRPWIDAALGILRRALEAIMNGVKFVVDGIMAGLNALKSWLQGIMAEYMKLANSIWGAVTQGLAGLWSSVSGALSTIGGTISAGLGSLWTSISSGLQAVGGRIAEGVSWIWKQMEGFFSAIAEVLKQIGTWIINAIKTHVVDPILAGLAAVFEAIKGLIAGIWNFITGGAVVHSPVEWRGSYVRWLGIITGVSVLGLSGFIGAALADVIHPFKDTRVKEVAEFALRFSGMTFLQGAFFTTYFDIACAKPLRQELNATFTPEIPGAGDLIRFVVREVLPPDEFYLAMSLQGFSRYWSGAYWDAHWILPPTERVRTAFLRKLIPEAEYRKFLIWYDFKPDPRPGISLTDVDIMLATQYDWPGAIETRWLGEWGIITPEDLVTLLEAGGLHPDWAPRVAEAVLLNQTRDELARVRGVYDRALRAGFMKPDVYTEALHGLHYAPHVINVLQAWAEADLALAEKVDQAEEWERLAKAGVITPDEYGAALRDLGMTEERITRAMRHIGALQAIAEAKAAKKGA